jgi:hypothetical protein
MDAKYIVKSMQIIFIVDIFRNITQYLDIFFVFALRRVCKEFCRIIQREISWQNGTFPCLNFIKYPSPRNLLILPWSTLEELTLVYTKEIEEINVYLYRWIDFLKVSQVKYVNIRGRFYSNSIFLRLFCIEKIIYRLDELVINMPFVVFNIESANKVYIKRDTVVTFDVLESMEIAVAPFEEYYSITNIILCMKEHVSNVGELSITCNYPLEKYILGPIGKPYFRNLTKLKLVNLLGICPCPSLVGLNKLVILALTNFSFNIKDLNDTKIETLIFVNVKIYGYIVDITKDIKFLSIDDKLVVDKSYTPRALSRSQ